MNQQQFTHLFTHLLREADKIGINRHALTVAIFIGVDCCQQEEMIKSYGTFATDELAKWRENPPFKPFK